VYFDKKKSQSRSAFVELWADYDRTHTDKEWSQQQNILINSMMQNAKHNRMTKEEYLALKKHTSVK
jgi:hypothetical protein